MSPLMTFGILSTALAVELLVIGFMVGYTHWGRSAHSLGAVRKLKDALAFERKERMRLAREHFEAQRVLSQLEGRVGKMNVSEGSPVQGDIEDIKKRYQGLKKELTLRKTAIVDLQTELSITQTEVERLRRGSDGSPLKLTGESIKDVLDDLVRLDGVEMALVADDQGLVIEASSGPMTAETLAVLSSLIVELSHQVMEVMPIDDLVFASLLAADGMVFDCCFVDLFDITCCVVVERNEKYEYPHLTQDAAKAIASRFAV